MAEVVFCTAWLHSASDLTDSYEFGCLGWEAKRATETKTVRRAQGRIQAVTTPGTASSAKVDVFVPDSDAAGWLDAHVGSLVLARGPRGERLWGFFKDVGQSEVLKGEDLNIETSLVDIPVKVSLDISGVTVSEVV